MCGIFQLVFDFIGYYNLERSGRNSVPLALFYDQFFLYFLINSI